MHTRFSFDFAKLANAKAHSLGLVLQHDQDQASTTVLSQCAQRPSWMPLNVLTEVQLNLSLQYFITEYEPAPKILEVPSVCPQAVFSELFKAHYKRVSRFILKTVRVPADAEELTQEVLFSAWKTLGSFRGDSCFSTWLLGIAMNQARNHCNRSPSRKEVPLPDIETLDTVFAAEGDLSVQLEIKEKLQMLDNALAQLSPDLRETIWLVRLEGLSMEDASSELGVPVGTIKSRLFRARTRLLEAMEAAESGTHRLPTIQA